MSQFDATQLANFYGCSARSLNQNHGCKDLSDRCSTLTSCLHTSDVEECCACRGGIQVHCWGDEVCPQAPSTPLAPNPCITDTTSNYAGYPCVFENTCNYALKAKCPGQEWFMNIG